MEVLYPRCRSRCSLGRRDGVRAHRASGADVAYQHRTVAETTQGLLELADCHVAMEARGVYWRPVWHVLED
jgi:transposase